MPKMIDLKLSEKESEGETIEAQELKKPLYPWGTVLSLDEETIKKLGFKELPPVDTYFTLTAMCCVVGTGERENQDGKERTLSLQIEKMDLESYKDDAYQKLAKKIYKKGS